MKYLLNLGKQSQDQIYAPIKDMCYFYQNFLHDFKERMYTAIKLKVAGQSDQSWHISGSQS